MPAPLHAGIHRWAGTPPGRYTPWAGTAPGMYTPSSYTLLARQVPPRQVHPQAGTPPGRYTPGRYPPLHSACWDTVNKWAVHMPLECNLVSHLSAVADPGFSPGGGANSQNCYYFSHFCRKLHENERIWTPRGGTRPWRPPLDPPMVCLCMEGGLCQGRSLSRGVSVQRVSVQGVSVKGCLCLGDLCPVGFWSSGSLSNGVSVRETPPTVKSGQYAFFWNAFLLISCSQGQNFKS